MTNYLSLAKVFIRSLSMTKPSTKKQMIVTKLLLVLVSLLIILPFVVVSGLFIYTVTNSLVEYNYETIGLEFMCILLCVFTFIFSFNVILNELYFTGDIENLLPLPLKPREIVGAKIASIFCAESLVQLLVIFFSVIGFFFALGLSFKNFLLGILGMITLPMIPIIYCSIISLLIMSFTRFIKNKETIRKVGLVFVLAVLMLFVYFLGALQNFDLELYIEGFVNGDQTFLHVMRGILPHINLFIDILVTGSIRSLLLYILVNIGFIVVLLGLADVCYFKGVVGLSSKDTESKKSSSNILNNIKVENPTNSYFKKEIFTLFRTSSYFLNCILINFIWPIFVYVICKLKFPDLTLSKLKNLVTSTDNNTLIIIFMFVIGVSILLPALNSIASSSFSREGKNFYFMKYIPMDYSSQVYVKLLVSFIIAFIGVNVFSLIFYLVIGLKVSTAFIFLIISFLAILFICSLGIIIDSINPKLVWDDELNALRENSNNFIVMGISIFVFIVLAGLCYLLYKSFGLALAFTSILLILILLNAIVYDLNRRFTVKNIVEQENL
ncbi:MAG: ABC transporter permease [Bacilli bacterium]|nr:ABC transporter permease [Bacilli bacterium]